MPQAAVLFLQAQQDGVINGASGQHAHGLWLNQWRAIDPRVGDLLHDARRLRPYTVSPLLGLGDTKFGKTPVRAGEIARLRLTALDDKNLPHILQEWLLQLPHDVPISGLSWQRQRVIREQIDHAEAGRDSYTALRGRALHAGHLPQRWQVTFDTPTAFHLRDNSYLPLPLPEKVVGSWLDLWQAYGQIALLEAGDTAESFLARIAAGLLLSRFKKLKSVSFRLRFNGDEVAQIGFVGDVTLDGRNLSPADRAVLATLADFAFYCGTGHHTTMGMGQTRARPVR